MMCYESLLWILPNSQLRWIRDKG